MPQVRGMQLKKLRAQPPILPTMVVMAKRKRQKGFGDSEPVYCKFDFTEEAALPIMTEQDQSILQSYRREVRACNEGACECVCRCHSGNDCIGDAPRIHTPHHKPQQVLIQKDATCGCDREGYAHHHINYCHDAVIESRYHERQPNTSHKGAHRECPKEGREHNRK